jgi:8-oxo-dGTP pyrophosphatase MutT (NUDIX family)
MARRSGGTLQAAGGILVRPGPEGPEVALVHRPKYDDWTFPKGKLEAGETHLDAALREVTEETGLRCRVRGPAGSSAYRDRFDRPKEVRYWLMEPVSGSFAPSAEVDELRWSELPEAAELLTYSHDRDLLAAVAARVGRS